MCSAKREEVDLKEIQTVFLWARGPKLYFVSAWKTSRAHSSDVKGHQIPASLVRVAVLSVGQRHLGWWWWILFCFALQEWVQQSVKVWLPWCQKTNPSTSGFWLSCPQPSQVIQLERGEQKGTGSAPSCGWVPLEFLPRSAHFRCQKQSPVFGAPTQITSQDSSN